MSERKCFVKRKSKIEQYKKKFNQNFKPANKKIRFMLPITIKCKICSKIIEKGKKINAFKEKILKENYCDMNLFRFYFRCSMCLSGSTIITDLKQLEYKTEINCVEL